MQLTVYLTNSCELACSHCAIAVNVKPRRDLSWAKLSKGLDWFLSLPGSEKEVSFTGGEPLKRWDVLLRACRKLEGRAAVSVQTNALSLTPHRFKALRAAGAVVQISLEAERGKAAVVKAVDRLRSLPPGDVEITRTLTPANAGTLVSDLRGLYGIGLRKINFHPDFFSAWDDDSLKLLASELRTLKSWLAALPEPLHCEAVERARRPGAAAWWKKCDTLVLGDDGAYYACHSAMMERRRRGKVGDVDKGVDWAARAAEISRAGAALDEVDASYKDHFHCPMLLVHGAPSQKLSSFEALERADRVARVLSGGLRDA